MGGMEFPGCAMAQVGAVSQSKGKLAGTDDV